jgi:hypothetical protein
MRTWIASGKVAENSQVLRRMAASLRISVSCFLKPMLSISSASSSTT